MRGPRGALRAFAALATSLFALSGVTRADAQPAPQPPPPPPPSATATQPAPDQGAPAPPAVAAAPDEVPTAQAPMMQAPPPQEPPPQPMLSPARDKRGNFLEARPPRLAWLPGEVVPPGYEPISGPSKRFLISGMVVGGAPYLGSFIAAYVAAIKGDGEAWGALFAPAVGPFIAIETAGAEDVGAYMLILDGLAQTTGIALTIVAFATKDHALKRKRENPNAPPAPIVTGDIGPSGASLKVEF